MKSFSISCRAFQLSYMLQEIGFMHECEKAKELAKEIISENKKVMTSLKKSISNLEDEECVKRDSEIENEVDDIIEDEIIKGIR